MLYVVGSMSTKTGIAPDLYDWFGLWAMNVCGVVMISSPGWMLSARNTKNIAPVPLAHPTQ